MDDELILDYETAERILRYFYFNSKTLMMFNITSLLLYTGGRVNEISSIELKRLNLKERFFINYVKSKKHARLGLFFFPNFYKSNLEEWLVHIKESYGDNVKYLFPSTYKIYNCHYSNVSIFRQLKKSAKILKISANPNPHIFRNIINEAREAKGVSSTRRALLLNQTPPGGVNTQYYMKSLKKIRKLREIYDKTFPFPEFNPFK